MFQFSCFDWYGIFNTTSPTYSKLEQDFLQLISTSCSNIWLVIHFYLFLRKTFFSPNCNQTSSISGPSPLKRLWFESQDLPGKSGGDNKHMVQNTSFDVETLFIKFHFCALRFNPFLLLEELTERLWRSVWSTLRFSPKYHWISKWP